MTVCSAMIRPATTPSPLGITTGSRLPRTTLSRSPCSSSSGQSSTSAFLTLGAVKIASRERLPAVGMTWWAWTYRQSSSTSPASMKRIEQLPPRRRVHDAVVGRCPVRRCRLEHGVDGHRRPRQRGLQRGNDSAAWRMVRVVDHPPCLPGIGEIRASWPTGGSYFDEGWWNTGGDRARGRVGSNHRTLSTYLNAMLTDGFALEATDEPRWLPSLPTLLCRSSS
jgi:hypothetical protein